ncbi:hypothetical protein [Hydrogenophaga sp. 5NK40-0174]|uniref:hypothetical protein n=1 Tax=Hydrogenophaga sp. 5NK40-0174 TaxID=3127649 RepID=UPI003103438B
MRRFEGLGRLGIGPLMWMVIASAHAWEVHRGSLPGDAYTLSSRGSPAADLNGVLASEKGRLQGIFLGRLVDEGLNADASAMQSDILNHLREKHPRLLEGALRSAGNLHNPKVVALRPAFEEAVLHSAYVAEINEALKRAGYRVTGVESEKFFLLKGETEGVRFDALLWIEVERVQSPD